MSNEKYLGEAALKDKPKKKLTLKIRNGSITSDQLSDELKAAVGSMSPVTNEEIDDLFKYLVVPSPDPGGAIKPPPSGGTEIINPGVGDKTDIG